MTSTPAVNEQAAARITAMEQEARDAGFSPAAPWFAVGTELIKYGQDKFRQSRKEFEDMPYMDEAAHEFTARIDAEQRREVKLQSDNFNMINDGRIWIRVPGFEDAHTITPHAFAQLCARLAQHNERPNPTRYLAAIESERRAMNVNADLKRGATQEHMLRVRQLDGAKAPEIFAVVGPKYPPADAVRLVEQMAKQAPDGARGTIQYSGSRTRADVLYHADLDAKDVAVGELYKAGTRLTTDDDGSEGIRCFNELYRAICINLTTVSEQSQATYLIHRGKVADIVGQFTLNVQAATEQLRWFWQRYQQAGALDVRTLLASLETLSTPEELVKFWFAGEKPVWQVTGATQADVVENVLAAWTKEPGWTVQDFSNAFSRAAHEGSWSSPTATERLEALAGELVLADAVPVGLPKEEA